MFVRFCRLDSRHTTFQPVKKAVAVLIEEGYNPPSRETAFLADDFGRVDVTCHLTRSHSGGSRGISINAFGGEMDFKVNDDYLQDGLAKVERARSWSPRVISKLENFIHTGNDSDLFRISPLHWAAEKNVEEHEAIDLFLHSTKAGLFYMEWNVVCSCCAKISQSLRDLHSLQSQSTCKLCFRKEHANLDDSVQISFTLSPAVRSLRFHHPETLSLEEFCFNYLFEPSTIVNGMMPLMDAFQYIQKNFSAFSPGDKIAVETEVGVGSLTCLDVFGQKSFGLIASGAPEPEIQKIAVKLTDSGFEVPLSEMEPGEFMVGPLTYAGTFYAIHPGKVRLEFEQCASAKTALLVGFFPIPLDGLQALEIPAVYTENYPEFANAIEKLKASGLDNIVPLDHSYSTPRLTAKQLFASQTFHDLFRSEVFQEAEGFGIKDVTILFTDLKSSTQLYQQIGDLNAYALVREHYGILSQAVLNHHGAVVKTIGDAIMANFTQPVEAVAAGHEMLKELRKLNRTSAYGDLILKIGIHRGAAISVTLNERIDYFGQTVNIASRVQGSAGGNEIYITEEICSSPGVRTLLESQRCKIESVEVHLKGIEEQIKIYKVTDLD